MSVAGLLRVLVECEGDAVAAALHERVRFRQGDGTVVHGRAAVLEMFARSTADTRYSVAAAAFDTVRVVIEVPGVPGSFSFLLCGRAEEGTLIEVWVDR
jgi:hypothetical protein